MRKDRTRKAGRKVNRGLGRGGGGGGGGTESRHKYDADLPCLMSVFH